MGALWVSSVILGGVVGALIYALATSLRPLYWIRHTDTVRQFVSVSLDGSRGSFVTGLKISAAFFRALKLRSPALAMPRAYLDVFSRAVPLPTLALIDRRHANYEIFPDMIRASQEAWNSPVLFFSSRRALLLLPVRFVFEHVLFFAVRRVLALAYILGVLAFWAWTPMYVFLMGLGEKVSNRTGLDAEIVRKREWLKDYISYFEKKWEPLEIGFAVFKILEGFQFRRVIDKFGFKHPNCEFGIEDGVISTVHLKGVDFVDVGCEVFPPPVSGDLVYKSFESYFIEKNKFADESFSDVYMIHVVDHIPKLEDTFRELRRITKPGGNVFFSGLSKTFSGYYLERFVYQGTIFNNQNLEWYQTLAEKYGFEVTYRSYCHSGLALAFWKFTTFFHFRTSATLLITCWYKRSRAVRWFYRRISASLVSNLCLIDDEVVQRNQSGLNFMIVMRKTAAEKR